MKHLPIPQMRFFVIALLVAVAVAVNISAQEMPNYVFLEVVDSNGQAVVKAKVNSVREPDNKIKTDENGGARFYFSSFSITKSGFFPFNDLGIRFHRYRTDTKVELLKIPQTDAERKILGDEQLKREFMWAAKTGDAATLRKLLKAGLDPRLNTKDLRGIGEVYPQPAIMLAAASGNGESVELFLKAGIDVQAEKYEPLHGILNAYLMSDPFAEANAKRQTLAEFENGAKHLIDAKANVHARAGSEETTLMFAARKHYSRIAKMLIESGVSVNATNQYGETALTYCITAKDKSKESPLETVRVLLKSGADPNLFNQPTNPRRTALQYAATEGWLDVIDELVAAKADINLADETGETALTKAVWFQQVEVVKRLLALGADTKGKQGELALAKAKKYANDYRDLTNRGSGFEQTARDYEEIVRLLQAAMTK